MTLDAPDTRFQQAAPLLVGAAIGCDVIQALGGTVTKPLPNTMGLTSFVSVGYAFSLAARTGYSAACENRTDVRMSDTAAL